MPSPSGSYSFYPQLDYIQPSFKNLAILVEAVDKNKKDAGKIQQKLVKDCFARKFQPIPTLNDLAAIARQLKATPAFDEFHKQLAVKATQGRFLGLRDVYARFYDSGLYKEMYDQFKDLATKGSEAVGKLIKVLRDDAAPKEWKAALLTNELAKHVPSQRQLEDILRAIKGTFLVPVFNESLRKMQNTVAADIAEKFVKSAEMRDALAEAAIAKQGYKESAKVLKYLSYDGGYKDIREFIDRGQQMAEHRSLLQMPYAWGQSCRRWLEDEFLTGDLLKGIGKIFIK